MDKLGISLKKTLTPYTLGCLNDTATIHITQREKFTFSIGQHYKDNIYCDIEPADIFHPVLRYPWEFDRKNCS